MGYTSTYRWKEDLVSNHALHRISSKPNTYLIKHSVNWYQRNYPYAWVGARLVRDL
jgi:hypothetical protein